MHTLNKYSNQVIIIKSRIKCLITFLISLFWSQSLLAKEFFVRSYPSYFRTTARITMALCSDCFSLLVKIKRDELNFSRVRWMKVNKWRWVKIKNFCIFRISRCCSFVLSRRVVSRLEENERECWRNEKWWQQYAVKFCELQVGKNTILLPLSSLSSVHIFYTTARWKKIKCEIFSIQSFVRILL